MVKTHISFEADGNAMRRVIQVSNRAAAAAKVSCWPASAYCDRPLSVACFVLSIGTASRPFFIVVSTLTVVSVVTIMVSWVCLRVMTVSFTGPMRSVCCP